MGTAHQALFMIGIIPSTQKALLHFNTGPLPSTPDVYGNTAVAAGANVGLTASPVKFGTHAVNVDEGTSPGLSPAISGIRVSGINFPVNAWTQECFVRSDSNSHVKIGGGDIFYNQNASSLLRLYPGTLGNSTFQLVLSSDGIAGDIASSTLQPAINANQWYHIAMCYDPSNLHYYTYLDGVKQHDIGPTAVTVFPATQLQMCDDQSGVPGVQGFYDEYRLSNVCRYPGGTTFTPPTAAFTS